MCLNAPAIVFPSLSEYIVHCCLLEYYHSNHLNSSSFCIISNYLDFRMLGFISVQTNAIFRSHKNLTIGFDHQRLITFGMFWAKRSKNGVLRLFSISVGENNKILSYPLKLVYWLINSLFGKCKMERLQIAGKKLLYSHTMLGMAQEPNQSIDNILHWLDPVTFYGMFLPQNLPDLDALRVMLHRGFTQNL